MNSKPDTDQGTDLSSWVETDGDDEVWRVHLTNGDRKENLLVLAKSAVEAAAAADSYANYQAKPGDFMWIRSMKCIGYITVFSLERARTLAHEMQERLSQDE
jgi:hypothetical protein